MKIKYSNEIDKKIPKMIIYELVELIHTIISHTGIHVFDIQAANNQLHIIHTIPHSNRQFKIEHSISLPYMFHETVIIYVKRERFYIYTPNEFIKQIK